MGGRKRSHGESEGASLMGVGDVVSRIDSTSASVPEKPDTADSGGEWQKVDRPKKRKKTAKKESGNYPSISHSSNSRLQTFVKLSDLQNLILYLLADGTAPQWCSVRNHANVKKVVALMVPGLEEGMFCGKIPLLQETAESANGDVASDQTPQTQSGESDGFTTVRYQKSSLNPDEYYPTKLTEEGTPEPLRLLGTIFDHLWPIITPGDGKFGKMHSPLSAMLVAPIVKVKEDKRTKGPQPPPAKQYWKNDRTSITEFLASVDDLLEHGFTLHPAHFAGTPAAETEATRRINAKTTEADGWVDTLGIPTLSAGDVPDKDIQQGSILAGRKALAIDCEMCITSPAGQTPKIFSLTRVSVTDWDGDVVLDEFVKPAKPITDYLTPYSGITAAKLENVTTELADIQRMLLSIITPHTILIGHSIDSDLRALQLTHPFLVDTALLFPHARGPPLKASLKFLSQKYLSRAIQTGHGSTGHDSIEDARACLDLVKQKCEKGKAWGTAEANTESIFKRISRAFRPKRDKVDPSGDDEPKVGAVVDWGYPTRGYGSQAKAAIGCGNDDEIVAGIKRALVGDEDSTLVPKGGCDFIWARLRELEAYRGWWDQSKSLDAEVLRESATSKAEKESLAEVVKQTVERIHEVYQALPPCTALVVYSGSGDPRELRELQAQQKQFKEEYEVKRWDELSVKWTDTEEQKLRQACGAARMGLGLIAVK